VIEIIHVSKKFKIWEDRSRDLKETTINFLRGKKRSFRELWALRGIDVRIKKGETVAFIGENGSGKSTLLKLLSGIYTPDEGEIVTQGKISTLLELGVGFHPDLTGEENIFLNGSMLGFNQREMKKKFEEIVNFSEIGDFIYSPIRTYSSGMAMRLAFSIAMCVDPDILLIDEVLAVGDEAFQKKCLERLETFKRSGRTIVLVSHSLEIVQKFCERAILLHGGRVVCDDVPKKTIETYHLVLYGHQEVQGLPVNFEVKGVGTEEIPPHEMTSEAGAETEEEIEGTPEGAQESTQEERAVSTGAEARGAEAIMPEPPLYQRYGTFEAEITEVRMKSEDGTETDSFLSGEMISIRLHIRFHKDIENPNVGIAILRQENGKMIVVHSINTLRKNMNLGLLKRNADIDADFIQRVSLPEGEYYLTVAIINSDGSRSYDWHDHLRTFRIRKLDPCWEAMVDLNSQIVIHS